MSTKFVSKRSHFVINRPPRYIQTGTGPGGQPAFRQESPSPIEFSDGQYVARTAEEEQFLFDHSAYGESLDDGDFTDVPEEVEEPAEAETAETEPEEPEPEPTEPEEPEPENEESGETESAGPEPGSPEEAELSIITGVSNKSEAVRALESTGLDVEVTPDHNKDEIIEWAADHGYRFEDY